jgi:streptogramin lyase
VAWAAAALLLMAGLAQAAGLGVEEAPLAAGGDAYELNAAGGALILTDYGAAEIRRIVPSTDAYTAWKVAAPVDGRQDAQGRIWFTSGESNFGYLSPAAGTMTTWAAGDPAELTLSGVAFDAAGRVWLTEWFGSTAALRRFDPATRELCVWTFPGGVSSYYAVVDGSAVWTANWANDRLVRFDPATGQGRRWALGAGSDPLGLAVDADGHLWAADGEQRQLLRLAPASGLLTRFSLPAGTTPQIVALIDGLVWYTESAAGTVGSLDPASAAGSSSTVGSDTFTASPACSTLPAGTVTAAAARGGALAWSGRVWDEIVASGGWTVYQLPAGASPFGIAAVDGAAWVVDRGRQVLARPGGPASTETPAPTQTPTLTPIQTQTLTPTQTPSQTPAATTTPSPTGTPTVSRTPTATNTVTAGPSPTRTSTATVTNTATPGPSPTPSPTASSTSTAPTEPSPTGTATGQSPALRLYLPLLQR